MSTDQADAGHAGVFQTLRQMPRYTRFALLGVFVNQLGAFLQAFMVLYLTYRGFSESEAALALGAYAVEESSAPSAAAGSPTGWAPA